MNKEEYNQMMSLLETIKNSLIDIKMLLFSIHGVQRAQKTIDNNKGE